MDFKGQGNIAGIAVAVLVFMIVLVIYGNVQTSLNMDVYSLGVQNLINLIPLVLVGSTIVGVIVVAFRMSG